MNSLPTSIRGRELSLAIGVALALSLCLWSSGNRQQTALRLAHAKQALQVAESAQEHRQHNQSQLRESLENMSQWQRQGWIGQAEQADWSIHTRQFAESFGIFTLTHQDALGTPLEIQGTPTLTWVEHKTRLKFQTLHESILLDTLEQIIPHTNMPTQLDACRLFRTQDKAAHLEVECELRWFRIEPQPGHNKACAAC